MINKRFYPGNYSQGSEIARLIGAHSKGLDRQHLKEASAGDYLLEMEYMPKEGKSYVHLITLGAGEFYGPNSNADFFNKTAGRVRIPNPKKGEQEYLTLDGGLEKYHNTFMKYGGVYREHANGRKGNKSKGNLIAEGFNPQMKRGELIVELDNNEWSGALNKLASGKPVFWSMGAGVKFDICSECGNKAKTRGEYCDHMRNHKLEMTKEGNQIFAYNDAPHFHDISEVAVPADAIAHGLRKVASAALGAEYVKEESSNVWMPLSMMTKMAGTIEARRAELLEKMAEMEKRIIVKGMTPDEETVSQAFSKEEIPEEIAQKLDGLPLETVISSLNNAKIMLPPRSFVRIVGKQPIEDCEGLESIEGALPEIFSSIKDEDGLDILSDGSYTPLDGCSGSGLGGLTSHLAGEHSLEDEPLQKRIIKITIQGPVRQKAASLQEKLAATSPATRFLAKEYAKYQLSFLASLPGNDKYAHLVVLKNQSSLN